MELIPENDAVSDRPPPELVVRHGSASGFRTWCILCGEPMEAQAGPRLYLKGPGYEPVCKRCGCIHDPVALNELKWRRQKWKRQEEGARE
ncbi:hypothetical protein GGQ04_003343 [Salinibacter ruber]|uniref:hypothetical protein n=1 Tax=Salinibacter ruber TaxID=146919 RepID=UPI00216A750E|nr:hypothetical protein [Salinibacter ruber]MCS4048184.1 hypothetical protein [Salinibacter ruber]